MELRSILISDWLERHISGAQKMKKTTTKEEKLVMRVGRRQYGLVVLKLCGQRVLGG